jgi:hypothetical protein
MLIRLLKVIARRRGALGCTSSLVILIAAVIITFSLLKCQAGPAAGPAAPEVEAEAAPRLLLGRLWFNKLPEKPRDEIDLWIFLGGGIGIHENGSPYRATFDVFEFERRGSKIDATNLHDKKVWKTAFSVRECDDHAPFNACLTLEQVNGKKLELYGFMYEDEMESAIPGSKAILASAKARSSAK